MRLFPIKNPEKNSAKKIVGLIERYKGEYNEFANIDKYTRSKFVETTKKYHEKIINYLEPLVMRTVTGLDKDPEVLNRGIMMYYGQLMFQGIIVIYEIPKYIKVIRSFLDEVVQDMDLVKNEQSPLHFDITRDNASQRFDEVYSRSSKLISTLKDLGKKYKGHADNISTKWHP